MIPTEMPTGRTSRVEVSNAKRNDGRLAGRLPNVDPECLQTYMFDWTFNQPLHAPWYYYGRFGDLAMS